MHSISKLQAIFGYSVAVGENMIDKKIQLEEDNRQESEQNQMNSRERVKHLLMGSPRVVKQTIQTLHVLGYAEVGAWSKPQIAGALGNQGDVISILIKHIPID